MQKYVRLRYMVINFEKTLKQTLNFKLARLIAFQKNIRHF
jgi:hypothetical protein